jgi:hypothetical protein
MGVETRRRVPNDAATTGPEKPKPTGAAPIRGEPASTPIAKAHQAILDALDQFEQDWADVSHAEQGGTVTASGRAELVADAARPASHAIDAAVAQAESRAQRADQNYQQVRNGLSPQSSDVAAMLRADAIWRRASQELDALPAERLIPATQRLIERASPAELSVLAEELPSFLSTRDVPTDWLDSALEAGSPTLKTAAAQRKLATQAHAIIGSNARAAKRAMQSAGHGSYRRPTLTDPARYDPDAPSGSAPAPAANEKFGRTAASLRRDKSVHRTR